MKVSITLPNTGHHKSSLTVKEQSWPSQLSFFWGTKILNWPNFSQKVTQGNENSIMEEFLSREIQQSSERWLIISELMVKLTLNYSKRQKIGLLFRTSWNFGRLTNHMIHPNSQKLMCPKQLPHIHPKKWLPLISKKVWFLIQLSKGLTVFQALIWSYHPTH